MNDRQVATRTSTQPEANSSSAEFALQAPVDIFEDSDAITLQLDMPGVSKERLSVNADKGSLTIEGTARIDMPEGIEPHYAEVRSTIYRRHFTLSSELEAENAGATLKDGVLTLRIPKRAELRPRKIEVRID